MRFLDLLRMSSSNLLRRKLRTFLTILGVVIGTASIVVMISLGLGLKKSSIEQIEEYGGLTTIEVYNYSWSGNGENEAEKINDDVIERMSQIEHVELVSPILEIYVMAKQGSYVGQFNVQGMKPEALQKMNIEVGEGTLPTDDDTLQFFYGNQVLTNFYNERTHEYYWDNMVLPDVDLMNEPLFVIFDMDAYWQSQGGGMMENGQAVKAPKKYIVPTSGVMAGGPEEYKNNCYNVFANLDALEAHLKKVFKNKVIPGQPTTASGKPYKDLYYERVQIFVDDMEHVESVQQEITNMGYEAYSNAEWMQQTQDQMNMIQLALGGIGAVSMLVAAISIANTMMMSIYERTKEIGIIKVLGCDMRNIRSMFLLEAGFIGFFGGLAGLVFSYGISMIINKVVGGTSGGYYSTLSYIPIWLAVMALGFAVLVGMVAGFFPALRAMKLSPLAAIRNE